MNFPFLTRQTISNYVSLNAAEKLALFEGGMVVLIDKPLGWTSFDVVHRVRMARRVKRVGHCGTLDPFATGLLVICFGKATKAVDSLMVGDKIYDAVLTLGKTTDSYDSEGEIISESEWRHLTHEEIARSVASLIGEQDQIPPDFSAIKIGGKPAYKFARKGTKIVLAPRKIIIHNIELLRIEDELLFIRVTCTKGTYIRSLARDIGESLGCGAFASSLRRIRSGDLDIDSALSVDNFRELFRHESASKDA